MSLLRSSGSVLWALRPQRPQSARAIVPPLVSLARKNFHAAASLFAVRSQVLKDVGEGITEVQIIQWYVEEGAHVEEWKPLCQYQSDKAVDDITSRYEGIIKKLHFQADDTVPTGKALCDIEVEEGKYPDDHSHPALAPEVTLSMSSVDTISPPPPPPPSTPIEEISPTPTPVEPVVEAPRSRYASLATPAVRGLLRSLNVNILDVKGTGKDGRVLKEDVHNFVSKRNATAEAAIAEPAASPSLDQHARVAITLSTEQSETPTNLTPIQSQMFKTMTKSLNIPHFLFADEVRVDTISTIRKKLAENTRDPRKITLLPFVIKAVSLALEEYPLLNARVDTSTDPTKPKIIMRSKHNIGIAMDTPQGLVVPNIKDVAGRSILEIAAEVVRLSSLGKQGKLMPADLSGGTITVSNIGNIGGTYVSPVLVPTEVAILGIGKTKATPVFDAAGEVARAEVANFSWSADHRVVDGATMARMATRIQELIESPELMLLNLR
ncbi:hypothetical protein ASPZODRAFT_59748 [Penicilliopsis zonata CBS 506.65]|uniref:Dihydrolipoamide acetyltransferase component of pyruvate dehydrogenase complex n=1 Tax=Penicilliopsis zonata CBS 506.65 TaxID=1073090 RepID=A0A1L9SQ99_9EURO|nr:hypothetical protein ASPZODRAFT_59748 [Penicilliopsis zonata CBS 506.65]OJJ49390.1 hypothetical protein ASPZODRAFT_59748 [Penicilliopsis zonata CBS 506.65]